MSDSSTTHPIRVKFLSRLDPREWRRYFPHEDGRWKACQFLFDRDAPDYEWLVVYDDVPPAHVQSRESAREALACSADKTILVTTEPASIKAYGRGFAAQFGHVLTSQPPWALPHPQRHYQQASNHWFFGSAPGHWMPRADFVRGPAAEDKTHDISVVYSPKRQWHTLHARRFEFIEAMRQRLPEMAVFGRGATPMADKAEALAPFRYHLAVENYIGPHHITEKLTDAFLGRCLPFYAGAPNAAEYFPEGSFIPIDVRDPEAAARRIRAAIRDDEWAQRLPAIEEARRRVLEEHHIFAVVCRIVSEQRVETSSLGETGGAILGRHAWRRQHRVGGALHLLEKLYVRSRSLLSRDDVARLTPRT